MWALGGVLDCERSSLADGAQGQGRDAPGHSLPPPPSRWVCSTRLRNVEAGRARGGLRGASEGARAHRSALLHAAGIGVVGGGALDMPI